MNMAFYYYRKYYFPQEAKTPWEARKIVTETEHQGRLSEFYNSDWFKLLDQTYKGIWGFVKKHTGY